MVVLCHNSNRDTSDKAGCIIFPIMPHILHLQIVLLELILLNK